MEDNVLKLLALRMNFSTHPAAIRVSAKDSASTGTPAREQFLPKETPLSKNSSASRDVQVFPHS